MQHRLIKKLKVRREIESYREYTYDSTITNMRAQWRKSLSKVKMPKNIFELRITLAFRLKVHTDF